MADRPRALCGAAYKIETRVAFDKSVLGTTQNHFVFVRFGLADVVIMRT